MSQSPIRFAIADPPTRPASQDFRDGAATGAALVASRARRMLAWGVPVDDRVLDKLAEQVVADYRGTVHTPSLDEVHDA
jgi:hypothetical protein